MRKRRNALPLRFSEYQPQARLSEEIIAQMEVASRNTVKIDDARRGEIELALQRYEYAVLYNRMGKQEPRRRALRDLGNGLEKSLEALLVLTEGPYFWHQIAAPAGIPFQLRERPCDSVLGLLLSSVKKLEAHANSTRSRDDQPLRGLLLELEAQFKKGGGIKTGVTNKTVEGRSIRGGRFVWFADAALAALPMDLRRSKSVGAFWERVYRKRSQAEATNSHFSGGRATIGTVFPIQLKR